MKRILTMALMALLAGGACAQHGNCGNCPNHAKHRGHHAQQRSTELQYNADGIELTLVRAFPTVKSVNKTDKWTEAYDANKKLLGYAVYSKPASDGIRGYAGETPVLVALTPKKVIAGVYLLPNLETPRYVKSVADAGFFNHWNGLTVKKALKKEVDAVSGATMTSTSVAKSVRAALEKL